MSLSGLNGFGRVRVLGYSLGCCCGALYAFLRPRRWRVRRLYAACCRCDAGALDVVMT